MITDRLETIRTILHQQGLDALLVSSPSNLLYVANFVCLAPTEREAYAVVTRKGLYVITSPLYSGDVDTETMTLLQTSRNASHEDHVLSIVKRDGVQKIGFEEHFLTAYEYKTLLQKLVPLIPANLRQLRIKKSDEELQFVKKACKIGDEAYKDILHKIKPGITEDDIATEMEIFIRRQGGTLAFPSIIGFGKHAAVPHHVTSQTKLKETDVVLMDFGVKVNGYCSDMTRTVYVGQPTDEQKKIYQTVFESQKRAIEALHTIRDAAKVDRISRECITSAGYPNYPHTLGHGIGLEVHEAPSLSQYSQDTLQNGMVFSIEPGIYLPEDTGVRIEDLVTFEKDNLILLTNAPKALTIL